MKDKENHARAINTRTIFAYGTMDNEKTDYLNNNPLAFEERSNLGKNERHDE